MAVRKQPRTQRRKPQQTRARHTVEAILDAVTRVLKREGIAGVTTNRIAAIAGVSIGSVYQYFPDKQAIFMALRDRHVDAMARMLESKLVERSAASLDELVRGLLEAMIDAHALDPALHDLLLSQVPHSGEHDHDFDVRLHGALRLAITARAHEFAAPFDVERVLFVLAQMIEALAHGVVLRRPASLSLRDAKEEAVRALLAYLDAQRSSSARARKKARASRKPA